MTHPEELAKLANEIYQCSEDIKQTQILLHAAYDYLCGKTGRDMTDEEAVESGVYLLENYESVIEERINTLEVLTSRLMKKSTAKPFHLNLLAK